MDPHILGAGVAPTPFTADEIRAGCPLGRSSVLLAEPAEGPPRRRRSRFVHCDDAGATIESVPLDDDGRAIGEPILRRSTWRDLQAHAAFPAERTSISGEVIELPLGS